MVARPRLPGLQGTDPARAFTLLEVMLVVAIMSVFTALSVPAVGRQVEYSKVRGAADGIAALLTRAQLEALASRRCVKVVLESNKLVAKRLNAFDCDTNPNTAPKIDASAGTWVNFASYIPDGTGVTLSLSSAAGSDSRVPSETTAAAFAAYSPAHVDGTTAEPDQLRFRPTGRLWYVNSDDDDDGAVAVTVGTLTRWVFVERQGLICTSGTAPPAGNALTCN